MILLRVLSLNQGYLHPLLEHPRLTCLGQEMTRTSSLGGEHSIKELVKQLINSNSEHLPVHELLTWLLQVHALHEHT
jgi:hypothetical protein